MRWLSAFERDLRNGLTILILFFNVLNIFCLCLFMVLDLATVLSVLMRLRITIKIILFVFLKTSEVFVCRYCFGCIHRCFDLLLVVGFL